MSHVQSVLQRFVIRSSISLSCILSACTLSATSVFALGGFDCDSKGLSKLSIEATSSSAGADIKKLVINDQVLGHSAYQVDIVDGRHFLNIRIYDNNRDRRLVDIETIKDDKVAAGLAWFDGAEKPQIIHCIYNY